MTIPTWCVVGKVQAANEVSGVYSPVTSKGHVISKATILKDGNWPTSESTVSGGVALYQSSADAKPKVSTPDQTILEQVDLLGC